MHFDINVARGAITVIWFLTFIGVCGWAWSRRRHTDFAAAARLPLEDFADGAPRDGEGV